jgi:cell division control protein 24
MADPLSIAGSVAGLLCIGLKVSHALGATINGTKSAPQSVNSLSRELSALCVTLGSLERILSLNNLSKYPQFPKVDLSNVLDTMMSDFILLQVTIKTFTDMHTDGFARKMWKRLTWVFREGAVLGLRNNLEAYKSTILMTITAVTLYFYLQSCPHLIFTKTDPHI